jgi:hypothetical protein
MARGQREGLFPRGLVFHGLCVFKIMFLGEFLKRMKEIIREMPVEEKFKLISSKEKLTEWVELKLMKFCDDVLYFEEDCSYILINLSGSRYVNDWICLYDDDELVIFCGEHGYLNELIEKLEEELKKA